jgi:hypothetical protein
MALADRLVPIAVAVFVIGYIVLTQPLSNAFAGISMNWIAVIIVAVGGILGFLQ